MVCLLRLILFQDVLQKVRSFYVVLSIRIDGQLQLFLDSNVTFFWTATTEEHNINYIGKDGDTTADGKTAKEFYDQCITTPNTTLPSGDIINNKAETPNVVKHYFTETGTYYFYCGITFNRGKNGHCKDGGVKAMVHVVDKDVSNCPYHPTC